ncbi:hypothetical protein [Methylocystis sp. SB2]|uniref:hypothetical protein n=1 Tax=Methylocystis sp. (strain SB2) TaxID=743836 RepID=UPI0004144EFC|nr:hypothetical protein [Methylocystis sp. SB2]ULO23096.1 hypothetical protein LNB28_13165 [Methylocystis sp. SB2]
MDLFTAVSVLTSDEEPKFRFEREFAAATFAGWLNWPREQFAAENVTLVALLHATAKMRTAGEQIDSHWFSAVFEPETFLKQIPEGAISLPDFWFINDGLGNFDETRYAADIVRFLLSYKSLKDDKRYGPSLGKASEFINQHGGFPGDKVISKRSLEYSDSAHQEVWRLYKKTSAFQFVRYYDSDITWLLDPCATSFFDELAQIASMTRSLQGFFSKARWVQEDLIRVIDRRSLSEADLFIFPESVIAQKCRVPKMPKKGYAALANYERNRAPPD